MHGANQMGLGPDFGNGFGGFGSPEGMAENAVATGTMTEAEAYGSFDVPGNVDGGGGLSTAQTNAVPTINVVPDQPISPQITSFTNALKAFMGFGPMQQAMKWGMSMMPEQMRAPTRTMNMDELAAGVQAMGPGFNMEPGAIPSAQGGRMNVPMTGFGANMGIASNVANIGGQNVHMGPGMMMNEDFFPGYGTNPFSGAAMADPSDPYIRQRRGTEIAGMVGP